MGCCVPRKVPFRGKGGGERGQRGGGGGGGGRIFTPTGVCRAHGGNGPRFREARRPERPVLRGPGPFTPHETAPASPPLRPASDRGSAARFADRKRAAGEPLRCCGRERGRRRGEISDAATHSQAAERGRQKKCRQAVRRCAILATHPCRPGGPVVSHVHWNMARNWRTKK